MGHVFISYSHRDTGYAHVLADSLQRNGFDVWIDERLDYGSQWPHELQTRLDSCDAFILIMTPRSYATTLGTAYLVKTAVSEFRLHKLVSNKEMIGKILDIVDEVLSYEGTLDIFLRRMNSIIPSELIEVAKKSLSFFSRQKVIHIP